MTNVATARPTVADTDSAATPRNPTRPWRSPLIFGACLVLLLLAPLFLDQATLQKLALILVLGLAISGLNIVAGFGGQLSLGHSAFMGLGAYTATILVTDAQLPVLATIPIAAVVGFGVGLIAGLPALRLKGHYLALVTLGFAVAFPLVVLKAGAITGGADGKLLVSRWNIPMGGPLWLTQLTMTYFAVVVVVMLGVAFVWNLRRLGTTRVLVAQRENPTAASVNGVNLTREKTIAFAVSAAVSAVAGSLYAMVTGVVAPEAFGLMLSVQLVAGLLLGGAGTLLGPMLGGVLLVVLPDLAHDLVGSTGANMFYGAVLILIMFVLPGGVIGGFKRLLRRRSAKVAVED